MHAGTRLRRAAAQTLPIVAAATSVFLLLEYLISWASACGTSTGACAGFCLAVAAGAGIAVCFARFIRSEPAIPFVIAGLTVLAAWLCPDLVERSFQAAINLELRGFGLWAVAAIPLAFVSLISFLLVQTLPDSAPRRVLAGTACGAFLFALQAWLPHSYAVTTTVLTVCFAGLTAWSRQFVRVVPPKPDSDMSRISMSAIGMLNAAAGVVMTSGWLILDHLFSVTMLPAVLGLAICCMLLLTAMFPILRLTEKPRTVWTLSMASFVLVPWLYSSLMSWNLHLTAMSPSALRILAAQGAQLAAWSAVTLLATISGARLLTPGQPLSRCFQPAMILCGVAISWMLSMLAIHPGQLAAVGVAIVAAIPLILLRQAPESGGRFSSSRIIMTGAAAAAVLTLSFRPPDLAAPSRLLFTARAQAAVARGIDRKMIPMTDASRLIDCRETPSGTFTLWRTHGDRMEWRINGIPVGSASRDTETTPQPAADVLACVLPLTVHPHPGSVLLLDDVSGTGLEVCRQFPLHCVLAVRPDGDIPTAESLTSPTKSGRHEGAPVTLIRDLAEIAVRDRTAARVDIIISRLTDPASGHAPARLNGSFYRAAARRLNDDGLFCQRIRQQRIGGNDVLHVLGTVAAAFRNLAVVQLMPGELAVLASNSQTPLLDKGVMKRMQHQHVRRQLAHCGWDWCQLAALPVVDSADPVGLWQHRKLPDPASSRKGIPGLRLAWEVVRPVNRALEIHQLFAPYQMRIAEAIPQGAPHEEFRRRISAYAQQVEVLTAFPDEPWTYRKSLKSEMQRNPRPPQEVVRNGKIQRIPHPLDQLRKGYLVTLGRLLQQVRDGQLAANDLRTLREFAADYEPLISDFVHYELVRIHELAGHPLPEEEFRHRLHTIYYTPVGDFSVRNVIAALDQLTDQPELLPDGQRFDQLNALVQELIQRWEARTAFEPRSAVRTQRDVALSLGSTRRALDQMEQLAATVGLSRHEFLTRRQFVSRALIGPLRDYRDTVLAHRAQHEPAAILTGAEDTGEDLPLLIEDLTTN